MSIIKPYNEIESKKSQVRTLFNRVAKRYDFLNHFLSGGIDIRWRKQLTRGVGEGAHARILDVAAGTGDLSLMLAKAYPKADVTGIDLATEMLAVARTKAATHPCTERVTFLEADAEALPFANGHFEVVTAAFGVRNFENLHAGITEMFRVLASGGRLFILEFSMPSNPLFAQLYRSYFFHVLPWVGGVISGDRAAYTYLPKSVEGSIYGTAFVELLKQIGFSKIHQQPKCGGIATLYTACKQ